MSRIRSLLRGGDAVEVSRAAVVGPRALGPTAMAPLSIAACAVGALAVGAVAIGRVAIANAVIRKLNAGEVEIEALRVRELEVGGRRWPQPETG